MKLGVFTPVVASKSFEEAVKYLSSLGVNSVELGSGGYSGKAHIDPAEIVANPKAAEEMKAILKEYDMDISALSAHGNPLHPNEKFANECHEDFKNSILAAEILGLDTVVGFSGCPGDCEDSKYPNWVTCSWPNDFSEILEWQWEKKLIPYWKDMAEFAKAHGVSKIAFEMHPGFCVYNAASCLRLRDAVGDIIGANFDPSHLYWQGTEPVEAIKALKGAIYHFHAKDTNINKANTAVNGVLDTGSYGDYSARSWSFRTVGYGHDKLEWNNMISTLKMIGYDGVISIEHEDALMSPTEGLEKAIKFLKEIIIYENPGEMWWV